MGKAKKVHFDVTIKATIDGKKGSRNFSSTATVLPERGGSYPTILGLVRASRKSGPGGRVLGVHNKGQVNGSAAFFDDTSVDYVNNIVKDLPNHGACAAFVKVQPTVVVPIPVFVLDDAQFKQVIELQGNNTEVNLIPSHTSRFESSRENDNTIDLIETEDQIGFNHKEVTFKIVLNYINFDQKENTSSSCTKTALLPIGVDPGTFECSGSKPVQQAALKNDELVNPGNIAGEILFHDSKYLPSVHTAAREAAKNGALALIVPIDPEIIFDLPVFFFNDKQFRDLRSCNMAFISITPEGNHSQVKGLSELEGKALVERKQALSYADATSMKGYKETAATRQVTGKAGASSSSFFKSMKRFFTEPKVRHGLKSILNQDCDWFPSSGELHSFQKAIGLLTESEASDDVDAEMNEISKQLADHIKARNHQVDVVLISFLARFLERLGPRHSRKGRKVLQASIEQCFDNLTVEIDCPRLFLAIKNHMQDKCALDPRQPLLSITSSILENLKKRTRRKKTDEFITKLLWTQVHHCGKPFDWQSVVSLIDPCGFSALSPPICSMYTFIHPILFQSLGVFIQPTLEGSCAFIENMCERNSSSSGDVSAISVDPNMTVDVTKKWIQRTCTGVCNQDGLWIHLLSCLGSLRFVQDNEKWKTKVISSFVQSFCAKHLLKLDFLWKHVDIEHSDYMVCRQIIVNVLRSKLLSSDRDVPEVSEVESLLVDTDIGDFLCTSEVFHAIEKYTLSQMKKSQPFNVKIHLLSALYNKLISVGDVEGDNIRSFVMTALNDAFDPPYVYHNNKTAPEKMFHIASKERNVFTSASGPSILESISQLVVKQYIKNANFATNPDCLLMLTLDDSDNETLLSYLTKQLKFSLCDRLNSIEEASTIEYSLRSKNASPDLIRVLDKVLLSAVENWSPSGFTEILQLSCINVLNSLYADQNIEAIGSKFVGLKHVFVNWTRSSQVEVNGLLLTDIEKIHSLYDPSKWKSIERLTGEKLVNVLSLDECLRQFDKFTSSIATIFYRSRSQSILDLFRRYECNIDCTVGGVARLLQDCKTIVDPSKLQDVKERHSISSIEKLSMELATFCEEFESQIKTAAYFLGVNCQLFSKSIDFGSWDSIQVEDFLEKVAAAGKTLQQVFNCESSDILSSTSHAVEIFVEQSDLGIVDHNALKNDVYLLLACPTLDVNESRRKRFFLMSSLVSITQPLRAFVDCCKQLRFKFIFEDKCFSELEDIVGLLENGENSQADFQYFYDLAERLVNIVSTSGDGKEGIELLVRTINDSAVFMTIFRTISRSIDVWIFVRDMQWFGKEGLKQFYAEFSNTTNKLLFASFESSVLDSLEPTVRFLSHVGSLHAESNVGIFVQNLLDEFKFDIDSRKQRKEVLHIVQQNISNIREWFDNGFDDMTNIFSRFDSVWESGKYIIDGSELCLVYTYDEKEVSLTGSNLDDFAQQLGFVQYENEVLSSRITSFLDQIQILRKVVTSQIYATNAGYPNNGFDEFGYIVNHELTDVDLMLRNSTQLLKDCEDWRKNTLLAKYPLSTLFWNSDLRSLYDAILGDEQDLDVIVPILSILVPPKLLVPLRESVLDVARECLGLLKHDSTQVNRTWIEIVSHFLDMCHDKMESVRYSKVPKPRNKNGIFLHLLECDCDEAKKELTTLSVISHVYNDRLPECFEMLDGFCSPSIEELNLFLERVAAFPTSIFMVTNVQALPGNHQEAIVNFTSRPDAASNSCNLHCVQLSDTILHSSPWVEEIIWDDKRLKNANFDKWKTFVVEKVNIEAVQVITSSSCGAGKTRFIRKRMEALKHEDPDLNGTTICIHEGTTLDSLVQALRKHQCHKARRNAIHFSFMLPLESCNTKLIKTLNHFFNHLLLSKSVRSPTTGERFTMGWSKWHIFVELPGIGVGDNLKLETIKQLRCHLPILCLSASIEVPSGEFDIDDTTHRVCTYLRAFSDGTIDRKFERAVSKQLIFVIDASGSMNTHMGAGRTAFQVALDNALNIFDTHIHVGDSFGTIIFSSTSLVQVQLQVVQDNVHMQRMRDELRSSPFAQGGTEMYVALNRAMREFQGFGNNEGQSWIVCLTDGQSSASERSILEQSLINSSPDLHLMIVGVNLVAQYENHLRDMCSKFGRVDTQGAFIPSQANADAMDNAFGQVADRIPVSETFELDGLLTDQDCWKFMSRYLPDIVQLDDMLRRKFWIEFLYRRVKVFDKNEDFNYNESHDALGSSLMRVMLHEAEQLLSERHNKNWKDFNHEQLIYDFTDPKMPQFRLICTAPDLMSEESTDRYESLNLPGFFIPTSTQLRQRTTLDRFLSQALNVPLVRGENGSERISCIDDNKFVLTLDFVMKLLNIHERVDCRIPCIIEGETGVSKTALTKMYSILRNSSLNERARVDTEDALNTMSSDLLKSDGRENSFEVIRNGIIDSADGTRSSKTELGREVHRMILEQCEKRSSIFQEVPEEFKSQSFGDSNFVLKMLNWFVESAQEQTFFELNVDASITETQTKAFFDEVSRTARKVASSDALVIVFLDEVNTSSIIGLFKEIVVDRTICGRIMEDNVVIVAACNPAGRKSLSSNVSRECDLARDWASGHYQVIELPPTMVCLKWQYGALDAGQEKEFIWRRMEMMNSTCTNSIPKYLLTELTELVALSQATIRSFAADEIEKGLRRGSMDACRGLREEAEIRAGSAVSLRDIQRVFSLFHFFTVEFPLTAGEDHEHYRNAMYLTIATVYYLKLDYDSRSLFIEKIASNVPAANDFLNILNDTMTKIALDTQIPDSIALTDGLKENMFMTLVCALSLTPLVIVGPPGSSKTLSVNIVDDNANGEESPSLLYRQFARLSTFHYQCSKTSTSNEVSSVFEMAIQRQKALDSKEHKCLVFMDEAGLPEEEKESLKVLHYYLEGHMSTKADVGFVAITNHVLDAAKSNRCVSLLRQNPGEKEMLQIANGVLYNGIQGTKLVNFNGKKLQMTAFASKLCAAYRAIVSIRDFETFYGLRDFIYFLKSLKERTLNFEQTIDVTLGSVICSLERNFNGVSTDNFEILVATFLQNCCDEMPSNLKDLLRNPLDVVHEALSTANASNSRYTLIIDESRDDSAMRVLSSEGLLELSKKTLFKLSNLGENSELERLSLVSGVKFAAAQGSKVVLSQTDSVNESFYDLFNQHFRRIRNHRDGKEYLYANIAVGGISRRSMVSPTFRCVLHVSAAELPLLPAPFLNRFEKYRLSVQTILSSKLKEPSFLKRILIRSRKQIEIFTSVLNLCGFVSAQTTESCCLDLLSETPSDGVLFLSDEKYSSANTFSDYFIAFAGVNLHCDLSVEDFNSIIEFGLKCLPLAESEALNELLKKSEITHAKEAFEECISGVPSTIIPVLIERLSELVITRLMIFKLLELATPEEIFSKRHVLPLDIVAEYFQQQHFGIKSLLQSIRSQPTSMKYIVHTRSDVDILRIPTLRTDDRHREKLQTVQKYIQDDAEIMMIEHLSMIKNESSLRSAIESWITHSSICTFLIFVDMSNQAAFEMINFVRCCMDQLRLSSDKRFVLILHYPPPTFLSNSFYPALSLGGWRHVYLNSICKSNQSIDLKHVIKKACIGFQDHRDLQINKITDEIMADVTKSLASHEIFYSGQISSNSTFHQRHELLSSILSSSINNSSSIRTILCTKFSELWNEKNLTMMLRRASWSLKKGTSQLGLTRCLQSIMKDTMRFFCLHYFLQLNDWRNFDLLLLDPSRSASTEALFHNILTQIPVLPFEELILHQVDLTQKLRELPSSKVLEVKFPFFLMISTLLDEVVECTLMEHDTQAASILSMNTRIIFHDAMTMLRKNAADEMYSDIALKTTDTVLTQTPKANEKSLYENYFEQFLTWRLCCAPSSMKAKWFIDKLHQEEANECAMENNLLLIHIAAKKYEMALVRLTSTSVGLYLGNLTTNLQRSSGESTLQDSDIPLPGLEVVRTMCSWFGNSIPELVIEESAKVWIENFSMFFGSLSDIIGNQNVICERTSLLLRISVFFYVLKENTSQTSTCLDCISAFYDEKSLRQNCNTSISHFVELVNHSKEDDSCKRMCTKELLNTLFSPQMLSNTDLHWESDLRFVMTDLHGLDMENTDNLMLTFLRNACIYGAIGETTKSSNEPVFDRSATLLSTSRLSVINNQLSCDGLSNFSEEGRRLSIPHFIPNFAQSTHSVDSRQCTPMEEVPDIEFFFSDYSDNFPSRMIAEAAFQIILEDTILKLVGKSSEQILTIFLRNLEMESNLSRQEQTRLRRLQSKGDDNNYVGSPLGILIVESYLVCLIFKISFELAKGEPIPALQGVYLESGWSVLNCAMSTPSTRLQEIFIKNIIRLGGQGKLFDLLRRGGLLHGLNWTKEWSGGLPEARGEIGDALDFAETELRDAIQEEERKTREMQLCPFCTQPFQILERNCGQFICGRVDTHTTPSNGLLGCGRTFTDSQARYYERNETLLAPLREAEADARQNSQAYNEMSRCWNRLKAAKLPCLSSKLDGDNSKSYYPLSIAVNTIGNDSDVIRHLAYSQAKIEHFLMLPDLVELYIWLHSTFKFIISAQQATSLTLGEVMNEKVLSQRFDRTHSNHILSLYERAKNSLSFHLMNCNNEVNWDCETVSVPIQNLNETPLIMVLSAYDHPTDGYDFLFIIINQCILQFNEFMFKLHGLQGVEAITPKALLHGSPAGLALKTLKFLSSVEFPLIVESYRTPHKDEYNVKALEEHFVEKLSACKFSIENPLKKLRSKFQFRANIDVQISDHQPMVGIKSSTGVFFVHHQDVQLFESCANQLNCTSSSQELEATFITKFHSLEYEQLRSMLEGIRNTLQREGANASDCRTYQGLSLLLIGEENEMEDIGFPSLTKSQLDLVLSLNPGQICELIHFLGYQLASESYNFATLPLSMKSTMPDTLKKYLRKNLSSLAEEMGVEHTLQLLNEFKNDVLSFYQAVIKDQCSHSNIGLKSFLQDGNFCDDSDLIFSNLPDRISVRNFVSLCQEMHQLTLFFLSKDRQQDFVEDEFIDTHSSYTNPRRGSCWLFNSKRDPDESQPSDFDEESSSEANMSGMSVSEMHEGLWFGSAQKNHEAIDDVSLSQAYEIPADYEFVQVESTPSLHSTTRASPTSSDDFVIIEDVSPKKDMENIAANTIQSWWRSIHIEQKYAIRSLTAEPQVAEMEPAQVHSQSTFSLIPSDLSQRGKGGKPEDEREGHHTPIQENELMSATTLFLVIIAAHVAFKLLEFIFS